MVLILASGSDEMAASLAIRWADVGARLMTPADLSLPGWKYSLPATGDATAIVAGTVVATNDITGVITRLSHITEEDLGHIAFEDRAFVAAEMEAFLTAWLDGLECPVINRPTAGCLSGPNWRSGHWTSCAARLGIPVVPMQLSSNRAKAAGQDSIGSQTGTPVIVAGGRQFGSVDSRLRDHAQRIADAAGVEMLEVRFTGPHEGDAFQSASLHPDASIQEIAAALLDRLQRPCACQ